MPPLADFLSAFGEDFQNYRGHWKLSAMERHLAMAVARPRVIHEIGFSIPCAEALDALAKHAPLIEVGAGAAAWSALAAIRQIDIIATDPALEKFLFSVGQKFPVLPLQAKTAVRRFPDRNVFCSWPSLNKTWLRQCARAMRPGRTLLVVREDATAEDSTWHYIESAFREIGSIELPCWPGMHDHLEIWKKRGSLRTPSRRPRP